MAGTQLDFNGTDTASVPLSRGLIERIILYVPETFAGRLIITINGVCVLINCHISHGKGFVQQFTFNPNYNLDKSASLVCYFYAHKSTSKSKKKIVNLTYLQKMA